MSFKFEELRVYQKAISFSNFIYEITKSWPSTYRFNLTDQIIRAALSIPLNIAEGSGRTSKDFQHFLSISRGSCYECIALITIAYQQKLITEEQYKELRETIDFIARMLSSLKNKI